MWIWYDCFVACGFYILLSNFLQIPEEYRRASTKFAGFHQNITNSPEFSMGLFQWNVHERTYGTFG